MTEINDPPIIDPRLLESGGPLALSIEGLEGDAEDEQDPKGHAAEHSDGAVDTIDAQALANFAHASTHADGATDTIDAQALANFAHGATHSAGSTDAITVENLDTAGPSGQFLAVGPSGNLVFESAGGLSESDALAQTLVFS
jgi:hypothetical protein